MKHARLTTLPLLTAALLAPLPAALAWPLQAFGSNWSLLTEENNQIRGFQADGDRLREYYIGGPYFMDPYPNEQGAVLAASTVELPLPDTDPYPANFPVTWRLGRGEPVDMDNDGDMDIVYSTVLHYNGAPEWGNVRIVACRNNGNGTWTRVWQLKPASPLGRAPEVKLADFDRDGDPDLLETSTGMLIRWNDGTGNFSTASPLLHGVYPAMPGFSGSPVYEVGDYDGNGWPDIALFANVRLSASDPQFNVTGRGTIYYNQDGSNFVTSTFVTNAALVKFLRTAQADIDGDGRTDLLATRLLPSLTSELLWFRNTGVAFTSGQIIHSLTAAQTESEVAFVTGDMDEDGRTDIVFAARFGEAQWQRNTGGGVFSPAEVLRDSQGLGGANVGVTDLEGDGDLDILTTGGRDHIVNKAPHLRCAAKATPYAGTALTGAVDLTTGDLNNDGWPDLIAADGGASRIRWYTDGGAGLTEQVFINTGSATPLSVAAGDWNGDGWTDIAWAGNNNTIRQALSTFGTGVGWNIGDAATMTGVSGILPGDIDHDGDMDLLSWSTGGVLRIQANTGAAAWLPQGVDSAVTGISRAALGETTPGGRQEIAALGSTGLSHWHHTGSAWSKTQPVTAPAGTASRGLCLADISDALKGAEIVYSLNTNSVYIEHPSLVQDQLLGTFSSPVVQLGATDWNRDGYTDIVVTTTTSVSLLIHVASVDAQFEAAPLVIFTAPAGRTLQDTAVLDLHRDGLPDAVTVDSAGALHVLTNTSYAVSSTMVSAPARAAAPGTTIEAGRFHRSYQSRVPGDAMVWPARVTLAFNRAVGTPGSDVAGTPMTDAEVNALITEAVLFRVRNYKLEYHGRSALIPLGGGQYAVEATPTGFIPPGELEEDFAVFVRLSSTAASAPVTRFFVLPLPAVAWAPLGSGASFAVRSLNDSTAQRALITLRTPGPIELWRTQHFGSPDEHSVISGLHANTADPDTDGLPNIIEYLTARNPNVPDAGGDPAVNALYDSGRATVVTDVRLKSDYDSRVKVTVQYSVDPTAGWGTVASRTGPGAWTGTQPYSSLLISGGRTRYLFDRGISPLTFPKAFYRIKAEEVP